jgi:hypothetical protein
MYTDHVQTVFILYTAPLWPSIFPRKFVFMCIVLSYLSVDTVHHTLLYTVVYGARNYRHIFRENKPKTLVFYD